MGSANWAPPLGTMLYTAERGAAPSADGPLRLDAVLGQSEAALTYNAWNLATHAPCAVKVLHPDLGAFTAALIRLRQDHQRLAQLHHPNLQPGCATLFLSTSQPPFLVRPLSLGQTLRQRLQHGPLPLPAVAQLFVTLCGALHAAHLHGVIHGDLKPENLLLTPTDAYGVAPGPDEVPLLLDFGLLHLRNARLGPGLHPRLGDVRYLTPEQILGDGSACDERTDVFALGTLLFECLTGRPAFGGVRSATLSQICDGPRPLPRALRHELPRALDSLLELAWHRVPNRRLSSPIALWLALRAALDGVPGVAQALAAVHRPSTASATRALLQQAELAEAAEPAADATPARRSTSSLRSRPRRPVTGAHAIQLFKEVEQQPPHPGASPRETAAEAAARLEDALKEARAARASQPLRLVPDPEDPEDPDAPEAPAAPAAREAAAATAAASAPAAPGRAPNDAASPSALTPWSALLDNG